MHSLVGHGGLRTHLIADLPPVALFVGPKSVGKWTTAEQIRRDIEIRQSDVLRIRSLTAEAARSIVQFAHSAPQGERKLILAELDGATPALLSSLLKTLEEPPATTHIILIASELPSMTITSRAMVYRFPLLSDEQVEEVLIQRGFRPSEAKRYAQLSGGQVSKALAAMEGLEAKISVLAAVRAIREKDANALNNLAVKWTDEHTSLLASLCREVITQRWRIFSDAEVEGIGNRLPLSILMELRSDIRPRLVVRSSLMQILKGVS